jgi:hypothetical protein
MYILLATSSPEQVKTSIVQYPFSGHVWIDICDTERRKIPVTP